MVNFPWEEYFHKPDCLSQLDSKLEEDVFDSGESEWVQASVDRADKLGFIPVDVFCGAIIPTKQIGNQNMRRSSTELFFVTQVSTPIPTCDGHGMIGQ
jgi:hypothetical protein